MGREGSLADGERERRTGPLDFRVGAAIERERERIVVPKKERLGAQFGKTFGHLKPCNYYRNETISSNILVVFYWSRSIF